MKKQEDRGKEFFLQLAKLFIQKLVVWSHVCRKRRPQLYLRNPSFPWQPSFPLPDVSWLVWCSGTSTSTSHQCGGTRTSHHGLWSKSGVTWLVSSYCGRCQEWVWVSHADCRSDFCTTFSITRDNNQVWSLQLGKDFGFESKMYYINL